MYSQGIVDELSLFHAQIAWGFKGKKVRVAGLVTYCNYLLKKKKKDRTCGVKLDSNWNPIEFSLALTLIKFIVID